MVWLLFQVGGVAGLKQQQQRIKRLFGKLHDGVVVVCGCVWDAGTSAECAGVCV